MGTGQTMVVHTPHDVAAARMQVREMARQLGLSITDQARIALATSTLARIIGLGQTGEGRIAMGVLENGGPTGLWVECTNAMAPAFEIPANVVSDAQQMVDELAIKGVPPSGIEVRLVKRIAARSRVVATAAPAQ